MSTHDCACEIKGYLESVGEIKGAVQLPTCEGVMPTPAEFTENGTYTAPKGYAYNPVVVDTFEPTGSVELTENGLYDIAEFAEAEVNVPLPSGTKEISIVQNGVVTEDVEDYEDAEISVNVPNSYSASDEGKVVDGGSLVEQTSTTKTENGVYDTTLNDEVTVNVQPPLEQKTVTPTKQTQNVEPTAPNYGLSKVTVNPIPSEYIVPSGTENITQNGQYDITDKANVDVQVRQPSGTKQISITQNGTQTEDVEWYEDAELSVNVPNSYTQADEGKVVSSGTLVSQTSRTVSDNGTYDTTLNNEVVVNNEDYVESLVAFGVTEDLADGIEAMTTYSNEVTGASDTTLSEAVATLANGYGGLLPVIDTITATEDTRSLNIDYTEYSAYDIVIVTQDIELTSSDWLYYNWNTTEPSGGSYNNGSRVKHTGVASWKLPLGGSSRNIVGAVSNMTFIETSTNINNIIIYTYTATKLIKAGSTLTVYGGNLNG